MNTVKFNEPKEFAKELAKDVGLIDRKIVRICTEWRPAKVSPVITHIVIVATALVDHKRVMLETWVGDHYGAHDPSGEAIVEKADELRKVVATDCRLMGLEVRGGVFE